MTELEDLTRHIHDKISSIRCMVDLAVIVPQLPQSNISKFGKEIQALEELLHLFEKCVERQNDQLKSLKELEKSFQTNLEDIQHINSNIPIHMPRKKQADCSNGPALSQKDTAEKPAQQENVRKTNRRPIRQLESITTPEYEAIPAYMRGRVTYDQLNVAVQTINSTVTGKYKILQQPVKAMNNHARKLYQRFKLEETKDTKGQFFVVEADIREFTQTKLDKRFQGILGMLRHCQRLRELRGGGLTRYLLL